MPNQAPQNEFFCFAPSLSEDRLAHLHLCLIQSASHPQGPARVKAISDRLGDHDARDLDGLKARCALLLARDLLAQGWQLKLSGPDQFGKTQVLLGPPTEHQQNGQKEVIRQVLLTERNKLLQGKAVSRFIRYMEKEREYNGRKISVMNLVADNGLLLDAIQKAGAGAIRPYLQYIASDRTRDQITGLRLIDVWRYFRLTWTLPYKPTPGRNLFFLVRDSGQADHPVMGIAALGNSIVHISDRDDAIGWTLKGLKTRLQEYLARERLDDTPKNNSRASRARPGYEGPFGAFSPEVVLSSLNKAIDRAIDGVNPVGLISEASLRCPDSSVITHLMNTSKMTLVVEPPKRFQKEITDDDWREASLSPLYTKKRAHALAMLLRARNELLKVAGKPALEALKDLLRTGEGRTALSTALQAAKKAKIGSSMMDIIVCGGIPPYSHLLAGKLSAMLMASPEVSERYRKRYVDQVSVIASCMKGSQVVRDPFLVFLGTTSLYESGSSQYNRIILPLRDLLGSDSNESIRFQKLGFTKGYGTVYVSDETVQTFSALIKEKHGRRVVHNTYGEGASPRLRLIRMGIDALGLPADKFLVHNFRRIVFGVNLARNSTEYLRGEESQPCYLLPQERPSEVSEAICEHWRSRWLKMRIKNAEVLERIKQFQQDHLRLCTLLATKTD